MSTRNGSTTCLIGQCRALFLICADIYGHFSYHCVSCGLTKIYFVLYGEICDGFIGNFIISVLSISRLYSVKKTAFSSSGSSLFLRLTAFFEIGLKCGPSDRYLSISRFLTIPVYHIGQAMISRSVQLAICAIKKSAPDVRSLFSIS